MNRSETLGNSFFRLELPLDEPLVKMDIGNQKKNLTEIFDKILPKLTHFFFVFPHDMGLPHKKAYLYFLGKTFRNLKINRLSCFSAGENFKKKEKSTWV